MSDERHKHTFELTDTLSDVAGDELCDIFGKLDTVLFRFKLQNIAPESYIRSFELNLHTPFEPVEQTGFKTFHLSRSAVARHDDLLVVEMQMIEDLSTGDAFEILNIVDYECVDALVEVEEAVYVLCRCGSKLLLEKAGCRIKDARRGIVLFDSYAYRLDEMRFSAT